SNTQTIKRDTTIPTVALGGLPASTTASTIDVSGTANDATSGVASVTVNGSAATFTAPSFTRLAVPLVCGPNTISAVSTDAAGNSSATASTSVTRICDTTAPVITVSTDASDTVAGSGWYNVATSGTDGVKVNVSASDTSGVASFSCTDGASTVLNKTYSPAGSPKNESFTLVDGTHNISCTATDGLGNGPGVGSGSTAMPVSYKVDQTLPTISGSAAPAANAAGWNNSDVTVSFSCSDATSTINTCAGPSTLGEGAAQSASGSATDIAGNTKSATVSGINIDKTDPVATLASRLPAANGDGWNNSDVTVKWDCTDALSGPASAQVSDTKSSDGSGQTAN